MDKLTQTDIDQLVWNVEHGFLDEEIAQEMLQNPPMARKWLNREPSITHSEDNQDAIIRVPHTNGYSGPMTK